ncbi:MAG: S8 family serine peptidase [Hyphomonadaceae bacterium]|nr:S8 family serine peptidase [Hyphomonadaceae bacterium]
MLVFELRGSLITFGAAIAAVPGLELIGEDIADLADDEGDEFEGFYYLVLPDARALEELLRLWTLWDEGRPLGPTHSPWAKVFECLHDLRRWGPQDRVSPADVEFIQDMAAHEPSSEIRLEIELIFRTGSQVTNAREEAITSIDTAGGRVLHVARHEGFAYDALLVAVPAAEALAIAGRQPASLAGLNSAFSIRVQSLIDSSGHEPADGAVEDAGVDRPPEDRAPILAIIDAVPEQNHVQLSGRLVLDDPLALGPLAVGPRDHGTAMASLIVNGNLDVGQGPLTRRVLHVPLLYADSPANVAPGSDHEVARADRILIDDFVTSVMRVKRGTAGQPALAPTAIIVAVSLGDRHRPFFGRMSPWARAIDWLAAELGLLFVVSAGNAVHPFVARAFSDSDALPATEGVDRSRAVLEAIRDDMRNRTLLAPGEAINAVTVGALHDDARGAAPNIGSSYDPLPDGRFPSLVSRTGPGFARAVKPDILLPGGRIRVTVGEAEGSALLRPSRANQFGGLRVCSSGTDAAGFATRQGWSGASSAAAALAARGAHLIHDALELAYGDRFLDLSGERKALVVKALLTHRARWPQPETQTVLEVFGPTDPRRHQQQKLNLMRLFGFGIADIEEALGCIDSRATLWGDGEVTENDAAVFRLPLPVSLSGLVIPHSVTATLAWFSPVLPGRRAYKSVRLTVEEPPGQRLNTLGVAAARDMCDRKQTERGTTFHRRWVGERVAQIAAGEALEFRVARKPDRDDSIDETPVAFGLAVSIEAVGEVPIYNEVNAQVEVHPEVTIPI